MCVCVCRKSPVDRCPAYKPVGGARPKVYIYVCMCIYMRAPPMERADVFARSIFCV